MSVEILSDLAAAVSALEEAVGRENAALAQRDRLARRAFTAPRGSQAVADYNTAGTVALAATDVRLAAELRVAELRDLS